MAFLLAALVVAADQLSKALVRNALELGETKTLIKGLLDLSRVHNDGAAYSILQGKQTVLIAFTLIMIFAMTAYMTVYRKKISRIERVALSLIIGGGAGNLIDRVMNGYVVDFINIHMIPVFNVADIAISCGCLIFIITVVFAAKK